MHDVKKGFTQIINVFCLKFNFSKSGYTCVQIWFFRIRIFSNIIIIDFLEMKSDQSFSLNLVFFIISSDVLHNFFIFIFTYS